MKRFRIVDHVDRATIDLMYESYAPVFILSTGRAGSKFIVELLNLSPDVSAFHEPQPRLQFFSDFASRRQDQPELLTKMIEAARMEWILKVYIQKKIFVESNQCLTFFAPVLSVLFKSSKFVHLIRHPGDFVASAARKGWYNNDSIWESGRFKMADEHRWAGMNQIERLGWLWNSTNRFIRKFLSTLPAARRMTCRLEDLLADTSAIHALFSFCGAGVPEPEKVSEIQSRQVNRLWVDPNEPSNMKKNPDFPAFGNWPVTDKRTLRTLVGETARFFGYEI
jgi:hypothetical protein